MQVHLLSGFLGSGKTTAIQQACRSLLSSGVSVGVITNDQGIKLVDGYFFKKLGIPERQVGNGCFCCNYNDLDEKMNELVEEHHPQVIFAESVGTCTDIVATVMKPLSRYNKIGHVTLTTVADARLLEMVINNSSTFDQDVQYIFFKQLEEAGLIVVNKTDLVDEASLSKIKEYLLRNYPGSNVILQCSIVEDGVAEWLGVISQPAKPELKSLELNYETYASGEAKMGYLDQQLMFRSSTGNAMHDALAVIRVFLEKVGSAGVPVGHLKFWLNDTHKLSFTATTSSEFPPGNEIENASVCALIVNARLQAEPGQLYAMMSDAIKITPAHVEVVNSSFFKPGYPKPVHRIEN